MRLDSLVEDGCLLEPSDWDSRLAIFDRYLTALGHSPSEQGQQAFEASIFARATRMLTPPTGHGRVLRHGIELLTRLATYASSPSIRSLCRDVLEAWRVTHGLSEDSIHLEVGDRRRKQLSKAMSYYLRHDQTIIRDPEGWLEIDALAKSIGSGVTTSELALVVTDFSEPRFEMDAGRVRARYGHTRTASIVHKSVASGIRLYHAAPVAVAEKVLLREGLRPMTRQYVHLSSKPEMALAAGRRHGVSLLMTVFSGDVVDLRHAAELTYVCPNVPRHLLHVVPISCLPV